MDSKLKIVELAMGQLTLEERRQARIMLGSGESVHRVCLTLHDFRRAVAAI